MKKLVLDRRVEGRNFFGRVDDGLRADVGVARDRAVQRRLLLAVGCVGDGVGLVA